MPHDNSFFWRLWHGSSYKVARVSSILRVFEGEAGGKVFEGSFEGRLEGGLEGGLEDVVSTTHGYCGADYSRRG